MLNRARRLYIYNLVLIAIIINQRLSLLLIHSKSVFDRFGLVVLTDKQFLSATLANIASAERRYVIGFSAHAHSSSSEPFDDEVKRNVNVYCKVDVCHLVKSLCLRNRTRESVEYVSVLAIGLFKSVFNKTDNHFIGDKPARLDERLCFQTERSAFLDVSAENIARRDMRNLKFLCYQCGLRAFSCAGCAQ